MLFYTQSYCVGITGGCEQIYTVASGDSCGAIETKTSLSDAQLRALNPWLNAACSTLTPFPPLASRRLTCVYILAIQLGQNICVKNSHVALPPPGPPANLNPGSWSK